jgi:hypothetical protein
MAGSGRDKGVNGSGHPAHPRFAANKGRGTDELRSQMDEAEPGQVVFRSVFPTHLSDAFQEHRSEFFRADPEEARDRERSRAKGVRRVPGWHVGNRPCRAPGRAKGSRVP